MDARTLRRINEQFFEIKRLMPKVRRGEVTDLAPLSVKLGGADVPNAGVRAITGDLAVGDQVAVLTFGRDMLVLGRVVGEPTASARVYNNAAITLTSSAVTALTFNSERWDSGGLHSTSLATGRLIAPVAGVYLVGGHVSFASNGTGERYIDILANGTTIIASDRKNPATVTEMSIASPWRLAVGEYVELRAYQSSGGNLDVSAFGANTPEFWMIRTGP